MLTPNLAVSSILKFSLLACSILLLAPNAQAKPWRGIVPLQSTRADVERILGRPAMDRDTYDSPDGRAIISYSRGEPCEEGVPGLGNIPIETVTSIYLSLSHPPLLSEVLVPAKQYDQIQAVHTQHIYYVDKEEGVRYTAYEGTISSISYFGTAADEKKFSCGEPKYAAPIPENPIPVRIEQYPFDRYGNINSGYAKARLDNFTIQLMVLNEKKVEHRGFIIVYAGRQAYPGEARAKADCSKDYLVKVRGADPATLVAVDGGHKEEFVVELYIYPINSYPPLLFPEVSPRKVQIRKGQFNACGKIVPKNR